MNRIEIEADLKFAAHRGCGTIISTHNHRASEGRLLGSCQDGRYRMILVSVDKARKDLPPKASRMLYQVRLVAGGSLEAVAETYIVDESGLTLMIGGAVVAYVTNDLFVGFTCVPSGAA